MWGIFLSPKAVGAEALAEVMRTLPIDTSK
jgi:hypothetical protein